MMPLMLSLLLVVVLLGTVSRPKVIRQVVTIVTNSVIKSLSEHILLGDSMCNRMNAKINSFSNFGTNVTDNPFRFSQDFVQQLIAYYSHWHLLL